MICNWYSIAGKKVRICQDWDMPIPMFEGFETEPRGSADVSAECYEGNRNFEGAYGVEYYKCNTDMPHLFFSKESQDVRLTASSDWSQMVIEGCKNRMTGVMEVFLAAFYSFLTEQGGVLAHASLIRMERGCVMFSGPSGIGKTTQAKLWNMYKAAEILNGDKVILLPKEEEIEAWGSPWRGSSSYGKIRKEFLRL